jgi:hypothetical protein
VLLAPLPHLFFNSFFLEYAGELRIIVLHYTTTPL